MAVYAVYNLSETLFIEVLMHILELFFFSK